MGHLPETFQDVELFGGFLRTENFPSRFPQKAQNLQALRGDVENYAYASSPASFIEHLWRERARKRGREHVPPHQPNLLLKLQHRQHVREHLEYCAVVRSPSS